MAIPAKQLEIDRVMNLIRAFGWEMVSSEIGDTVLKLTIQKRISPEVGAAAGGVAGTPGPG